MSTIMFLTQQTPLDITVTNYYCTTRYGIILDKTTF